MISISTILFIMLLLLVSGYFLINGKRKPYVLWTRTELYEHLYKQALSLELDRTIINLISEACYSDDWDPIEQFDGCTVIQDIKHPCLPCFLHDYGQRTGMGGKLNDSIFKFLLLKDESIKPYVANAMWFLVRVSWICFYKWKHIKKRNLNGFTSQFMDVVNSNDLSKNHV